MRSNKQSAVDDDRDPFIDELIGIDGITRAS